MNLNWDERYSNSDFAYGTQPNVFFREHIQNYKPESILMPADGEGRNGVYAATLGWSVTSFDLSIEGKSKALRLAEANQTTINFLVGDFEKLNFSKESFDAIAMIYAHFPPQLKMNYYSRLVSYLKPGGVVIFEAFSKSHLELRKQNPAVGGPDNIQALFNTTELLEIFHDFDITYLKEEKCILQEGKYHNGESSVVRFIGTKILKQD